ncbi:MAG: hypothetical protein AAGD07_07880 [Planctomycetota bacterium]
MTATRSLDRSWRRIIVRSVGLMALSAISLGAWMVYRGIRVSLHAEENLHTTMFTLHLVNQFVAQQGRWPHSWKELEQVSLSNVAPLPPSSEKAITRIGGQHGNSWSAAYPDIRERVKIDFQADPDTMVSQDPMEFTAIRPIGPYYEYRDYGFVESLQDTLREATRPKAGP